MDVSFEGYQLSRPSMGLYPQQTFNLGKLSLVFVFPRFFLFGHSFWRTRVLHTQMIRVSNHNLSIRITNKQKFSAVPLVYISYQTNKQTNRRQKHYRPE